MYTRLGITNSEQGGSIMTDKSINDILMKAHKEIQETHGISLSHVYYDLINVSGSMRPKYTPKSVSIEGEVEWSN